LSRIVFKRKNVFYYLSYMSRSLHFHCRIWLVFFFFIVAGCKTTGSATQPAPDATAINQTITQLYKSFSFKAGEEPDWNTIRSLALPGAAFVAEPNEKAIRKAVGTEDFIAAYKQTIIDASLGQTGYEETIINSKIAQSATVANVEVSFRAYISTDKKQRKPGTDNIQLLKDKGQWKIVAFTTQAESIQ
jgi:hypothetical protein